jgi:hypothetical protein
MGAQGLGAMQHFWNTGYLEGREHNITICGSILWEPSNAGRNTLYQHVRRLHSDSNCNIKSFSDVKSRDDKYNRNLDC